MPGLDSVHVPRPARAVDRFDEAFYLKFHTDVAEAVKRGHFHSGLMHYAITGRATGRRAAPEIDAAWYGAAYPMAVREVAAGLAADFEDHYFRIGRHRGYLRSAAASRPVNPAAARSRFGGLWTDHENALDVVAGKHSLGFITGEQAEMLRHWITEGYVVLSQAVDPAVLDAAEGDLERVFAGHFAQMRFSVEGMADAAEWRPEARTSPAVAHDPHWHSEPLRNLIFAPAVLDFLHLVFERRALASQSLGFWRGAGRDASQDSASVLYSLPMQFAASWIALEDVAEGAGAPFQLPGSHRMAEYRYAGGSKGAAEARRMGATEGLIGPQAVEHVERIALQAKGLDLRPERLLARRGDVLLWAADLAHGYEPPAENRTRKSVVTHYCPAEIAPAYFENGGRRIMPHRGAAFYASGYYG